MPDDFLGPPRLARLADPDDDLGRVVGQGAGVFSAATTTATTATTALAIPGLGCARGILVGRGLLIGARTSRRVRSPRHRPAGHHGGGGVRRGDAGGGGCRCRLPRRRSVRVGIGIDPLRRPRLPARSRPIRRPPTRPSRPAPRPTLRPASSAGSSAAGASTTGSAISGSAVSGSAARLVGLGFDGLDGSDSAGSGASGWTGSGSAAFRRRRGGGFPRSHRRPPSSSFAATAWALWRLLGRHRLGGGQLGRLVDGCRWAGRTGRGSPSARSGRCWGGGFWCVVGLVVEHPYSSWAPDGTHLVRRTSAAGPDKASVVGGRRPQLPRSSGPLRAKVSLVAVEADLP